MSDEVTLTNPKDGSKYRVVEDADRDLIQFFFAAPADDQLRATLDRNNFTWEPATGAWQQPLQPHGRYYGRDTIHDINKSV